MKNEEYALSFNMTPLFQELFKLYLSENFEDHQKDSEEFFEFFLQKLIESNKSDFYSLQNYNLISANTFQRHGFLITLKNVFMYSKSNVLSAIMLFFIFSNLSEVKEVSGNEFLQMVLLLCNDFDKNIVQRALIIYDSKFENSVSELNSNLERTSASILIKRNYDGKKSNSFGE